MSKNNLRGITLVRGPIWGIHSLTLIISCLFLMIYPSINLYSKLGPIQYRGEYQYGLLRCWEMCRNKRWFKFRQLKPEMAEYFNDQSTLCFISSQKAIRSIMASFHDGRCGIVADVIPYILPSLFSNKFQKKRLKKLWNLLTDEVFNCSTCVANALLKNNENKIRFLTGLNSCSI